MSRSGELVVLGQGYVGLPLAREAVKSGIPTIGLDLNEKIVDQLNRGISHVDDIADADLKAMIDGAYSATSDPKVIADAKTIVICVPTPLDKDGTPNMKFVVDAINMIADHVSPGSLISLESTTYPGTTENVLKPALEGRGYEVGNDIHLAFSPERINPGDPVYGFRNTPKVVGGITDECKRAAVEFYSRIVDTVIPVSGTREAEMTKLIENTYRHVNIALMNELAQAARGLGVDLIESINAAKSKPFGYEAFYPGPGVGGHCIPIDPNYLSYTIRTELGHPFRFVELAQEVNNSMPAYVVSRIAEILNDQGKPIKGSKILLLGVTYKSNIADQRESPAIPIGKLLLEKSADIRFHDPLVNYWQLEPGISLDGVVDLEGELGKSDAVVLLQNHSQYGDLRLEESGVPVLDTRGVLGRAPGIFSL